MDRLSGVRTWRPGPDNPSLTLDRIHIWRSQLDVQASIVHQLVSLLSQDEQARVQQLRHHRDRTEYIVVRGLLRIILDKYRRKLPSELRFGYSHCGKPFLIREHGEDSLSFNVSHSGGVGLIAVAGEGEIGVDIERIRPGIAVMQIADLYFAGAEVRALQSLPDDQQLTAFYRAWVRKEAYVKARGDGLLLDLRSFVVSLAPCEPAALLSVDGQRHDVSSWSLGDVDVGEGFAAAVAIQGKRHHLACWDIHM